ncbi:RHS repeat domain-containing protein [Flavobacterium columnare]|uniref:RHS repeat-associated core domain-containing protein n=1 Tax=Flavobacterium columnare TaxID=996 RepID=A0AAI8GBJ2_9FLAO|nr:RHS repeat-associated core domain-containing protein [Flavobacterium columnare]AMO20681.2 RHS repeat-associated core domain-containing protein [Flavobacterium columnare]QOG58574.1 RHS repeat-associated core domain-containing protein [Flavobacterium columnare]QOG61296.1 RHS repeat-associated core domain-containing protein [Flavobacterium columnare]QOG64019.1 RHS repeat-associated core domain-containing protein [Flavobacterium columnare]QOG66744.1 RHS repeat-associated core domain-containing 
MDYDPFGSLVPNRHGSSTAYRYGFNGMEKDDELKGEGNSYDFGARMLDPRVGRWFSVDSKAAKFSSETTYGYVSNNPLVFIDPDGDEKIIVIGGGDKEGNDKAKFINAGLKRLNDLIKRSGKEGITLVITDKYLMEAYKKQIDKQVKLADSKYKGQVSVVYINNGDELTNYMNSKTTKSEKLSKIRKGDPITEVDFFGHGYRPDYSSQGPDTGSFEPAHCDKCGDELMSDDPSTRPDHNKWAWGKDDIDKLNKNAFDEDGTIDYTGICNAATPSEDEMTAGTNKNNLAKYTATKLELKSKGWFGRVDYSKIYDTKAKKSVSNPHGKTSGIGKSKSNPVAGSKSSGGASQLKVYSKKRS